MDPSDSGKQIVWAKGDKCLCPYSGDNDLYTGVIKKIQRSSIGKVTAFVQFVGYDDEWEEVDIGLLKKTSKQERKKSPGQATPTSNTSSGMFSPLDGNEANKRLQEKYDNDEADDFDAKAEELSRSLFQKKCKGYSGGQSSSSCSGSGRKAAVAIGSEKRKGNGSQKYTASAAKCSETHTSPGSRKKCKLEISGGQAVDPLKELRTSKRLSDLSSILDSDRVRQALSESGSQSEEERNETTNHVGVSDELRHTPKVGNNQSSKSSYKKGGEKKSDSDSDDSSSRSGFSDNDLEKPKFSHTPEGAKVPFILSEDGEIPIVQVPGTLNQYLRDYQREGIRFMYSHYKNNRGAILGDDMGLGKTVQVIGLISAILGKHGNRIDVMRQKPQFIRKLSETAAVIEDSPTQDPLLIIGPGCVLYNWLGELETWGYFVVRKFHGTDKAECLADVKKGKVEIVVTTYETFREHQESLNSISWNAVFVDEVHKIKGLKAQTTQALRTINTKRRLGLTGTALQNNLLEFWSLLDWAQPGCLGRQIDFEEEFVKPIGRGQRCDANKRELALARKKKEKFAKIRKSLMIRRTKSIIKDQLPKKDENVVFCKLSELQTSLYKTILSHDDMDLVLRMDDPCYCDSGVPQGKCCKQKSPDGTKIRSLMFTFMHLLLKASNHVALLIPSTIKSNWQAKNAKKICIEAFKQHPEFLSQTKEASFKTLSNPKYCGKMKILQGLLQVFQKEHSKVLVFSYSTQVLDILEQYMMSTGYEYRRIDGAVSSKKRLTIVTEFNKDPNIFICLISTKAGGLGLNLTGANRVVIFDPNWNPSHDLQAQDRAYRIGQRRNVSVYRLVSSGTIEENMYLRQIYKQQLLNISVEDENARRYFYAVQGSRQKKGELFGIKNMFALRTGTSSLTADIIKRNERLESALAGYEVAKYIPPVVRLQEDEDLEDVEITDQNTSTESEQDYFEEFFREDSPVRNAEKAPIVIKKETENTPNQNFRSPGAADTTNIKIEPRHDSAPHSLDRSRVRFEEVTTDRSGGKVKPHESRTGKGAKYRNHATYRRKEEEEEEEEEEVRFDQTLAGTFNDVTDVFENCGIVHIHEHRKVVGGSRAEDHMTRCAISDVYELHQNSQDLAVQCDPLSEESSEEEMEEVENSHLELQHNKVRSQVVGKTKILIGQTPKLFRMKQLEKLCQFTKSESLLEFAETILTSTLEERISMLKQYYENKDPVYKDIITLSDATTTNMKKSKSGSTKSKSKARGKEIRKKQATIQGKGLSFLDNDELSPSESLGHTGHNDEDMSDDVSSMDIGIPITPLSRKRKIVRNSTGKRHRNTGTTVSTHVPVMPSYMDTSGVDDGDDMVGSTRSFRSRVHNPEGSINGSDMDSGALLSQMVKCSQAVVVEDIDSVDGGNATKQSDDIVMGISDSVVMIGKRGKGNMTNRTVDLVKPGTSTTKTRPRRNDTSILDDLFAPSTRESPKRPPPKKGIGDRNTQLNNENNKHRKHNVFKEVDEIFSDSADTEQSAESEHEILLQTSTLKNDDYDCFDDPKQWKNKKKPKTPTKNNFVDRLIADSDAEYNELFTSGKLKRKTVKTVKDADKSGKCAKLESPLGNVDGSESLFSF